MLNKKYYYQILASLEAAKMDTEIKISTTKFSSARQSAKTPQTIFPLHNSNFDFTDYKFRRTWSPLY